MPGVKDNDPLSSLSCLSFSVLSPFCKFVYLNFGCFGVLAPIFLFHMSYFYLLTFCPIDSFLTLTFSLCFSGTRFSIHPLHIDSKSLGCCLLFSLQGVLDVGYRGESLWGFCEYELVHRTIWAGRRAVRHQRCWSQSRVKVPSLSFSSSF